MTLAVGGTLEHKHNHIVGGGLGVCSVGVTDCMELLISNHGVHFNPIYLDLMMVDRGFGDLNLIFGINCKLTPNS